MTANARSREAEEACRLMRLIMARLASDELLFVPDAFPSWESNAFIFRLPIINSSRRLS